MRDKILGVLVALLKPRSLFAGMMYLTFCYLAIVDKISEEAVIAVVASLMTFYYAERKAKKDLTSGQK